MRQRGPTWANVCSGDCLPHHSPRGSVCGSPHGLRWIASRGWATREGSAPRGSVGSLRGNMGADRTASPPRGSLESLLRPQPPSSRTANRRSQPAAVKGGKDGRRCPDVAFSPRTHPLRRAERRPAKRTPVAGTQGEGPSHSVARTPLGGTPEAPGKGVSGSTASAPAGRMSRRRSPLKLSGHLPMTRASARAGARRPTKEPTACPPPTAARRAPRRLPPTPA